MLKINVNSELIRKFSEVIRGILSMIEKGEYEKALELIDGAFKDFFRLGSKFFNSLSEDNLLELARTNTIMDVDKCIIMAKLLMEEARVFEKLHGKSESFYLYAKSLYLYVEAYEYVEEETELDKYFSDIGTLIIKVSDYKLDADLQKQLVRYNMKKGAYDKADNILYDLLEDTGSTEESKAYAAEIYKALLSREDAELVKGNLTREEVTESLESISC
jgi:tetratricopeptide (TPR) repeat protein